MSQSPKAEVMRALNLLAIAVEECASHIELTQSDCLVIWNLRGCHMRDSWMAKAQDPSTWRWLARVKGQNAGAWWDLREHRQGIKPWSIK